MLRWGGEWSGFVSSVTAIASRIRPRPARRRAMRGRVFGAVAAGAALALWLSGLSVAQPATAHAAGESGAHGGAGPWARAWVTTVDRSELLRERAPVAFRRG